MGYRTLSWRLVLRALFLDGEAYDRLRDDDNPFFEGLFFVVIVSVGAALLNLIGQLVALASVPSLDAIESIVLDAYQGMPWWSEMARNPEALATFNRMWDLGWQVFPRLFGAPSLSGALFNLLAWPLVAILGWLLYGVLAFVFSRLFGGQGTLNQTLGTTALAASPMLLSWLGFIPFLAIGGVISTWQLICRYMAVRSTHGFTWQRAFWVTVLPYAVYLVFWILLGALVVGLITAIAAGG